MIVMDARMHARLHSIHKHTHLRNMPMLKQIGGLLNFVERACEIILSSILLL
jgi:hypothetical protein